MLTVCACVQDDEVPMTRKEKLAMWRARRLAAKAAEEEAADAERQVFFAMQECRLHKCMFVQGSPPVGGGALAE